MIFAARTAVQCTLPGVNRTKVAEPPRCKLERNSPAKACRFMAATTLSPTTKTANVTAACSRTKEFLHHDVGFETHKGLNNAFRGIVGFRQHHADPLRAFQQLDHQRRAANLFNQIRHHRDYWQIPLPEGRYPYAQALG